LNPLGDRWFFCFNSSVLEIFWRLFLLSFFLFNSALAYEVDNFTDRDLSLRDARPILDQKVTELLDRAARVTRVEDPGGCSPVLLRQEILRWIRPDPTGIFELWLEFSDEIEKTPVGVRKSIYRNVSFLDSPILKVFGIGRSFRLAGHMIGTDKIGHFFMQGLDFYHQVRGGRPLREVLERENGEDGLWGWGTSGVKSWADIAADYAGYRFWSRLVEGTDPYFRCVEEEGWVRHASFSWADYVDASWDEAINCSEMKPGIRARVDEELTRRGWTCPMDREACSVLAQQEWAPYLLSPSCRTSR
jgi:hypothetical protein